MDAVFPAKRQDAVIHCGEVGREHEINVALFERRPRLHSDHDLLNERPIQGGLSTLKLTFISGAGELNTKSNRPELRSQTDMSNRFVGPAVTLDTWQ